jgi:hypothetical protein
MKNETPKTITILGKRWFSRTYGNTYFTARVFIDGVLVKTLPREYGYGDYYKQAAWEWLDKSDLIKPRAISKRGHPQCDWEYCQQSGITLLSEANDVSRQKDLD